MSGGEDCVAGISTAESAGKSEDDRAGEGTGEAEAEAETSQHRRIIKSRKEGQRTCQLRSVYRYITREVRMGRCIAVRTTNIAIE